MKIINISEDGGDRISELPDEVLGCILSFLSSNEAIATCLLSKRWRYVWKMVPVLDFVCLPDMTIMAHTKVSEFLRLFGTKRITRFQVKCKGHSHPCWQRGIYISRCNTYTCCLDHIQELVDAAIAVKVEQLSISMSRCQAHEPVLFVPTNLFNCAAIVTLKLEGPFDLEVPSCIQLPSMKSLHLNVRKCKPSCEKFLSGSPSLEEFYLKEGENLQITRNSQSNLIVSNNLFLRLIIQSDGGYDYVQDYLEGHLENVVKAKVSMTLYDRLYLRHLVQFIAFSNLKSICNVEYLSLNDSFKSDMDNSSDDDDLDHDLPQFPNLVRLDLHVTDLDHSPYLKLADCALCPKLEKYWLNDIPSWDVPNSNIS